jgi:ABC-type glycerol-3-phosphate transport system permease component
VISVLGMLLISSLAAIAFAKQQFRGREVLFVLLMSSIMIPIDVLIPPLYVLFAKLRWLSTYTVQIVPSLANVMALFLLRQYMIGVPNSLLDAAKIDGAGTFRIYRSIMLPICIPPLTTVGILSFMNKWSEYLWPLLMVNKTEKMPIMVVLPLLTNNEYSISFQYEYILAGCTIATLPILVLFFVFNKKLILSVTAGAIKG